MSSQENYSFLLGTLHFEKMPLYHEREYQQNKTLKLNFLKLTVAHHISSNTRNYNFLI